MRSLLVLVCALVFFALPALASAQKQVLVTGEKTSVPQGWIDFCQRYPAALHCVADSTSSAPIEDSMVVWREINSVNKWVNIHVTPMTDVDHWHAADRWDIPNDGKGDCEDYALWKRWLLHKDYGIPYTSLLMTVVRDKNKEAHAVLIVETRDGDYVLDDMTDMILAPQKTGYVFVKRQSPRDPNMWLTLRFENPLNLVEEGE